VSIDRTPYNALVDDDGSNLVGSVWNKNQIKTVLLDPIDAALVQASRTVQRISPTGTMHDVALTVPGVDTLLLCGNGSLLTLDGIAGGVDGQQVTLISTATSITLGNNQGSTAGNRFYNVATSGPTPLGPLGSATYQYDAGLGGWRLVAHVQGPGLDVAFGAGNFTASAGGSWTVTAGQVVTNRVSLIGTMLHWTVYLGATTIGGTPPAQLLITIPYGFRAASTFGGIIRGGQINDAGGQVEAIIGTASGAGSTTITIQKNNNAAWAIGTSPAMLFSLVFEIQ